MKLLKRKLKSILFKSKQTALPPSTIFTKQFFWDKSYIIGEYSYGIPNIREWGEKANLNIGKFCSIADNVSIFLGGNHRTDWISTYPFGEFQDYFPKATNILGHPATKGDVIIGNDVWIGSGVTILSGVNIGDGAVLAANSVVVKNVLPYEIVAGNPARVIRKRFDDEVIQLLLQIAWWNWPIEKINSEVHYLCSSDIRKFITRNLSYIDE
jgi:acetyltransferase-like isoleucine patch superfamily enzyme